MIKITCPLCKREFYVTGNIPHMTRCDCGLEIPIKTRKE
jgi:hypothetical protein